jgi:curved DNA-binding protein CbpA
MKTLYDLLEALPDDDADGLRAAFRKAAKANHPDFNPGDAEASERFRRIVRANAILSDQQQRAEYDRLLELAKRQQSRQVKRRSHFGMVRWLAADALMSAVVSVMLIGGYFVYRSAERSPLIAVQAVEIARAEPAQAVVVPPTEITEASSRAVQHAEPTAPAAEAPPPEHDVNFQTASKPAKPDAPALMIDDTTSARGQWVQGRRVLPRTRHTGLSQRRAVSGAGEFRRRDRPRSRLAGFLHRPRHCLPSLGRSEARPVGCCGSQAPRRFESKAIRTADCCALTQSDQNLSPPSYSVEERPVSPSQLVGMT